MSKTKNTKLIFIAFIFSRVTAMFIRILIKHKKSAFQFSFMKNIAEFSKVSSKT